MESLDRGPFPISAPTFALAPSFVKQAIEEDEFEDDEEDEDDFTRTKSGSIHDVLQRHMDPMKGRREADEEEEEDLELGLAMEIRRLSKTLIRVDKRKMEMMMETERCWLEMENRWIQMILNSNRMMVDATARAFETEEGR